MEGMSKQFKRPVIIIAAARSGTKMLREVLAQSTMFVEFPYDMNYIWLYGNYGKEHDELSSSDLSPKITKFIRNHFDKMLKKSSAERVLEKSVPNSLRVEFVRQIFPKAQIIHLYRNGIDVSLSAMRCWDSSLFSQRIQKKSDLFNKIIYYPYLSAYPYLKNYISNYVRRMFSKKNVLQSWGPRYREIAKDVEELSLIEVCGKQWDYSVKRSLEQLSSMRENYDFINVRYEDLVRNPEEQLRTICSFLDVRDTDTIIEYGKENIRSNFIDTHKVNLSREDKKKLIPHIESSLINLGYL